MCPPRRQRDHGVVIADHYRVRAPSLLRAGAPRGEQDREIKRGDDAVAIEVGKGISGAERGEEGADVLATVHAVAVHITDARKDPERHRMMPTGSDLLASPKIGGHIGLPGRVSPPRDDGAIGPQCHTVIAA